MTLEINPQGSEEASLEDAWEAPYVRQRKELVQDPAVEMCSGAQGGRRHPVCFGIE